MVFYERAGLTDGGYSHHGQMLRESKILIHRFAVERQYISQKEV